MRLQVLFLAIVFAMICEYHCQNTTTRPSGWNYDRNYEIDDRSNGYSSNYDSDNNDYNNNNNNYNDDDDNYNDDDDDDNSYDNKPSYNDNKDTSEYRSQRTRKSPDEYGNMNLYFRTSSKGGKKKYKKMRFPVNRFDRKRAPRFPPLLSFFPWLPIFADRRTRQTIIFSPTGGVYIIPPVINFYGDLFSIAELIASGYCSLVSSGIPPPPAVDVAPLVQPGAVVGPGIPATNPATGGFVGGVSTELRKLRRPKYPKTVTDYKPSYGDQPKGSGGGYGY